jgi:AcrR family transcriptional regulator
VTANEPRRRPGTADAGTDTRPGRPRSHRADRAILDSAVDLLCRDGLDGFSIEAVAAGAGVSRPTVYRRYSDRDALLHHAVSDAFEAAMQEPELGDDPRDRVLQLLMNTVRMLTDTPIGPLFRAMIPHLPAYPALGRLANELGQRRRRRLRVAMAAARAAGAIDDRRDLDTLLDGILGAIYFRYLITGRALDAHYVKRLVETLA